MKEIQDTWAKKAKKEGYRSRAAYKLLQINKPHQLIENSDMIIELGSAPGGWSQVIAKLKRENAECHAFDLIAMENVEGIHFHHLDLLSVEFDKFINNLNVRADLILSDMSVNLSGIKVIDDEANKELNLFCLELSNKILNKRGALLIKTFTNQNLKTLKKSFENAFEQVFIKKPHASKTSSAEVYLLGLILK